jgi:hypothetical protein
MTNVPNDDRKKVSTAISSSKRLSGNMTWQKSRFVR